MSAAFSSSWSRGVHEMRQMVTNCGHSRDPYPKRVEKVKFGVPLEQVCKPDIPAALLVLILKINKQGPYRKDVFRAPGHQASIKKLIHCLQTGRMVNIEHYSVYTIASVLKKFLRKLPGGIFGVDAEERLFRIIQLENADEQRRQIHEVIRGLSKPAQRLLVLLFGTFRVIAMHSEAGGLSGMSAEAIGVSVAPSFMMSCIGTNKHAKLEDIQRYKLASKIISFVIDNFAVDNLFGRENYVYYARITGRVLRVDDDWIFAFDYPHEKLLKATSKITQQRLTHKHSWLQLEALKFGIALNSDNLMTPEYLQSPFCDSRPSSDRSASPARAVNVGRITMSASDHGNFGQGSDQHQTAVDGKWEVTSIAESSDAPVSFAALKDINSHAENTRSLSFLPIVHERQAARMKTRSEWFLAPVERKLCETELEDRMNLPTVSYTGRYLDTSPMSSSMLHHSLETPRMSEILSESRTTARNWNSAPPPHRPSNL